MGRYYFWLRPKAALGLCGEFANKNSSPRRRRERRERAEFFFRQAPKLSLNQNP